MRIWSCWAQRLTLDDGKKTALSVFWEGMKKKKVQGDRFNGWFKGASFEAKCLAMQMGPKENCVWGRRGKGFACEYCVGTAKPCCRVVVGSAGMPVRVTVLPEHDKEGMERFKYWK